MTRLLRVLLVCLIGLGLAGSASAQLTPVGPSVNLPAAGCYQINNDSFICRSIAGTFTVGTTKNGTDGILSVGTVLAGNGTAAAPSISFASEPTTGWYKNSSGTEFSVGGVGGPIIFGAATGIAAAVLRSDASFGWNVDGNLAGNLAPDTTLARASAGVVGFTSLTTTGADVTLVNGGTLVRQRYQATITPATGNATNCGPAFAAAALTADCTIATLKAGEKLVGIYADVTTGLTCSGTCTGTKTIGVGKTAGGTEFLVAALSVATTNTQFGLADADLGTTMTRATQIQGGSLQSWSSTTPVIVRFTSGTGNWGNAATTFVNAGSVTFTLLVEQVK